MLPNLTKLTIDVGTLYDFPVSALIALIEARACPPAGDGKLRQLILYIPSHPEDGHRASKKLSGARYTKGLNSLDGLRRVAMDLGFDIEIRTVAEERRNLNTCFAWVDRDEELVDRWPEARNAFVSNQNDDDRYGEEYWSSDEDGPWGDRLHSERQKSDNAFDVFGGSDDEEEDAADEVVYPERGRYSRKRLSYIWSDASGDDEE